jgi:TetR/AcrR family transcriptional regulator, regulator of cefoperazone and chloramphenicol sensitivity
MVSLESAAPATVAEPARHPRPDGEASRARLLGSGLRLFAQQGFARTSTRELADAAGVNVAAIRYYFGDKAGLYRAVFLEPMGSTQEDIARYDGAELSLAQALAGLYAGFLEPLRRGDEARLCMKLHLREMLEPSGLWQEQIDRGIKPMHDALLAMLCRHFGVAAADEELHRLAVCIAGLGVHMHVGHDVIVQLAPDLGAGADALDRWAERLTMYAQAMIEAERARRAAAPPRSVTT